MSVNLITNNWNPWNDDKPHIRASFPSDERRGDAYFISHQIEIREYCLVAKDKDAALQLSDDLLRMAYSIRHLVERKPEAE